MQVPASFGKAERQLLAGGHLTGEQLATLPECNPEPAMPDVLHAYVISALRGRPHLPAGRKARVGARWDFTVAHIIDLYEERLLAYRTEDKAERARARAKTEALRRIGESMQSRRPQGPHC
jgi:hypothetical protein